MGYYMLNCYNKMIKDINKLKSDLKENTTKDQKLTQDVQEMEKVVVNYRGSVQNYSALLALTPDPNDMYDVVEDYTDSISGITYPGNTNYVWNAPTYYTEEDEQEDPTHVAGNEKTPGFWDPYYSVELNSIGSNKIDALFPND